MRVVIVHHAEHVRLALRAAQECSCSITLQSAPDALFYAGALYLLNMYEQEKTQFPNVDATFILDCADSRALAVQAMQTGHTHIRSQAEPKILSKLASIAKNNGVTLYTKPYEALDLLRVSATTGDIIEWIKKDTGL